MKKEILTLVIGILIGAIVTTGVFLIIKPQSSNPNPAEGNFEKMKDREFGDREERPNRKNKDSNSNSEEPKQEEIEEQ